VVRILGLLGEVSARELADVLEVAPRTARWWLQLLGEPVDPGASNRHGLRWRLRT
jgi:hypothetical protein